jgi:hypothetical protein
MVTVYAIFSTADAFAPSWHSYRYLLLGNIMEWRNSIYFRRIGPKVHYSEGLCTRLILATHLKSSDG